MSLADITDALKKISDFLQGVNSFLSGISFISETIGFGAIILVITIIVFSAGYSAVGVPRGKASFFASLITADIIWAMWKMSINAPITDYIFPLVRSNLIVMSPFAAALFLGRLAPFLFPKIRRKFSSLFRKKQHLEANEFLLLYYEYQVQTAGLNRSLVEDIMASRDNKRVNLSPETRLNIDKLKHTLEKFDCGNR